MTTSFYRFPASRGQVVILPAVLLVAPPVFTDTTSSPSPEYTTREPVILSISKLYKRNL
ncbi:hypothetical protein Lser_V15G29190 [Lactuca serriola]